MNKVREAFMDMLDNWKRMQGSGGEEEAEQDANRFEESFYAFIDEFRVWFNAQDNRPHTVEEALVLPEVESIVEELPAPLYINFETELEYIVEGTIREQEEKYD